LVSDYAEADVTRADRESYVRPPLEVVAFELRVPHALPLAERAAQTAVWEKLRDKLPLTQPQAAFQVALGGGPVVQPQPLRMLDRSRMISVVVGPESIVLENTGYRSFEDFCAFLRDVLDALPAADIAGFTRVGLRYINEIRVPGLATPADWEGLLAAPLLAPASFATDGLTLSRLNGELDVAAGDGYSVVMRYGMFANRVVNIEGPLRTRTSDTDPAFVIDLDSYWETSPTEELPQFSIEAVLETTARLRSPIHELFEEAITDRLRDIFREERT
jgi:uncharacterized protein (TIGR04255 family)